MGVFDEGCMGMYNAIIPDELLFQARRLQGAAVAVRALLCGDAGEPDAEARASSAWLRRKGMTFHFGADEATELTEGQVLRSARPTSPRLRIADEFGCETIGIQYQQGLKDLLPASRPGRGPAEQFRPAAGAERRRAGDPRRARPLTHFNEVDECAGLDGLLTQRVHAALGQPVENTLHDLRWGDWDRSGTTADYVWVFLISGSAPPAHHVGGYRGTDSSASPRCTSGWAAAPSAGSQSPERSSGAAYSSRAAGSRWTSGGPRRSALPRAETERRWRETTPQWPIMNAVTYGVSRDQMMARHKANHIHVAYADSARSADLAIYTKASLAAELGLKVSLCGTRANGGAF